MLIFFESTKITTTLEQPSKQENVDTPKKIPMYKGQKEKPQQDGRKGVIMIKSNPIPGRLATHNWRTIIQRNSHTVVKVLGQFIRLPSLGTQQSGSGT